MYKPLTEDALILRRYTPNWAAPDDRKINPWDLNEPDPTDAGTMGTIPGATIECDVGDTVVVHFRNRDHRANKAVAARTHSLHPHGFVFNQRSDGAFPLSPPDPTQPVGAEAGWSGTLKQGDRVPPDGTFTYTWETFGWPTTTGVWLYHDHSICDMDNVQLGAIGIVVIHNPADADNEVINPPLPGGSPNGSPVFWRCFPFPIEVAANPAILQGIGQASAVPLGPPLPPPGADDGGTDMGQGGMPMAMGAAEPANPNPRGGRKPKPDKEEPHLDRSIQRGELLLELDKELVKIPRFCLPFFRDPPAQAQYLLLFHELAGGAMMCINGRKYLGNTPTVVAGTSTRIRFGVVGMGNFDGFHTFHLHLRGSCEMRSRRSRRRLPACPRRRSSFPQSCQTPSTRGGGCRSLNSTRTICLGCQSHFGRGGCGRVRSRRYRSRSRSCAGCSRGTGLPTTTTISGPGTRLPAARSTARPSARWCCVGRSRSRATSRRYPRWSTARSTWGPSTSQAASPAAACSSSRPQDARFARGAGARKPRPQDARRAPRHALARRLPSQAGGPSAQKLADFPFVAEWIDDSPKPPAVLVADGPGLGGAGRHRLRHDPLGISVEHGAARRFGGRLQQRAEASPGSRHGATSTDMNTARGFGVPRQERSSSIS
jgi:FtsP/CotA-like multicopper oxidase with cupredoxin domain